MFGARREHLFPPRDWRKLSVVKSRIGLPLLFIFVFALTRAVGTTAPLASFSAAYALMFCAGVYFRGRSAWWLPLGAMVITDVALNFYYSLHNHIDVWTRSNLIYLAANYVAYVVLIWLGRRFKPQSSFLSLLGGGILGALLFYIITNTASWLFNPFAAPEYVHKTLLTWFNALTRGTGGWPETWQFFRNTLLSGGLFTAFFVGAAKLSAESPADKRAGARADDSQSEPEAEHEPEGAEA